MSEDEQKFYDKFFKKITLQIWLAGATMFLLSVLSAVILVRLISMSDINTLKQTIESTRCNCKGSNTVTNDASVHVGRPWTREDIVHELVRERMKGNAAK